MEPEELRLEGVPLFWNHQPLPMSKEDARRLREEIAARHEVLRLEIERSQRRAFLSGMMPALDVIV